jgi:hypothetical protein
MIKPSLHFAGHIILLAALSLILALMTRGFENSSGAFVALISGIFFITLAALFLGKASERAAALADAVSVELNKLRRIHHLARAFSRAEKQIPWFDSVREAIESYLHAFEVIPFAHYDDTNEMFRRITQQLYGFDAITSEKGKLLFAELMTISGQATEARQRIHAMRTQRMSVWTGGTILMCGVTTAGFGLFAFSDDLASRLAAAALCFGVFIVLQLVFMADTMRTMDSKSYTKQYVDNIDRMGFWPEEKM